MGIPDHESWLLREYAPSGHASGWRRAGCFVFLIGGLIVLVAAVILSLVRSNDDEPGDDQQRQSFACVEAMATLAMSEGSPVGVARSNLGERIASEDATPEQVAYYQDLHDALNGLSDDEPVEDRLSEVPCSLSE